MSTVAQLLTPKCCPSCTDSYQAMEFGRLIKWWDNAKTNCCWSGWDALAYTTQLNHALLWRSPSGWHHCFPGDLSPLGIYSVSSTLDNVCRVWSLAARSGRWTLTEPVKGLWCILRSMLQFTIVVVVIIIIVVVVIVVVVVVVVGVVSKSVEK